MKISHRGLKLIKESEGLELKAYPDPATGKNPFTIGFGSTRVDGKPVEPGQTITPEKAEQALMKDVAIFAEGILDSVRVELNQNQFDALVSFAYNVGLGNFKSSTLLRRINKKRFGEAGDEFLKWVYANKKILPGLVKRRKKERELFLTPISHIQLDIPKRTEPYTEIIDE